jgi:hypothetical protein
VDTVAFGEAESAEVDRQSSPEVIYEHLRRRILSGEIAAGAELRQLTLATEFNVSRGPVREALRLLQQEGLIDSHVNQRSKVRSLSTEEAEHLYALRVVNEAVALSVSVPRMTQDDLDSLERLVEELADTHPQDFAEWEHIHDSFHRLLLSHASPQTLAFLTYLAQHTERYRRIYVSDSAAGWRMGSAEHGLIARACRDRDVRGANVLLANHLARAGLTLVAIMSPSYEPEMLRAALFQVTNTSQL